MSKAILNRDVLDIIYEEICGYPIEEAYKILEDHRRGRYISKDWIKKWSLDHYPWTTVTLQEIKKTEVMRMVDDWEKENGKFD